MFVNVSIFWCIYWYFGNHWQRTKPNGCILSFNLPRYIFLDFPALILNTYTYKFEILLITGTLFNTPWEIYNFLNKMVQHTLHYFNLFTWSVIISASHLTRSFNLGLTQNLRKIFSSSFFSTKLKALWKFEKDRFGVKTEL